MPITLMLAATLRKYITGYSGETGFTAHVEAGSTVRDLARMLAIPEQEVKLIMVNGTAAEWDKALEGNERVALFPPVGGG